MNSRGLSVWVNIGGKILPSLKESVKGAEAQFTSMTRTFKRQAAEMKATWRSTMNAASPLLGLAAAGGLTMGIKGALGAGAEYQHQLVTMRLMGRSMGEVAASIAAANRTIRDVPTATLNDSIRTLNETTLAFGGLSHAMANLTFNEKMGSLLKAQLGDEFGGPDTFNKLVRLIELRGGKVDSATYQRLSDNFFRAITVSGGRVNADELLGFGQQALPAMRAYSEDYLSKVVPSLIQEFGGERAGTVSSALAMQFMGRTGIGGKSLVANWKKYGLLKPGAGNGNNGSRAGWNPKDVVGLDIGLSNPLQYFEQIMIPHLQKAGVNLSDPKQVMIAAQGLFGRQTGQRIASTFFDPKQRARIHADMALYDKASGVDKAYSQALYSDPRMAQMAAASSLKNMETMLGKSVFMSPAFTKAIVTMATGFNRLAGAFDQHPGFAKGVLALMGLGALAATLKVVGIGLRFILSPLKGLFALLFTVGPRNIGIVGWLLRGIAKGAPLLLRGVMALGGVLMEGLVALAPMVMEGIAGAFALLSNPVGWAIMAVIAVAAIWRFRHEIANIWTTKVVPWFKSAWTGLKSWLMGINWKAVGLFIADALTFGLASKFVGAMSKIKAAIASTPPSAAARAGNVGMNSHVGGLVGMRANGGPVLRGGRYLVGERGPEVVEFGANGRVIPNHHIAAMAGGPRHYRPGRSGGIGDVTININGARDPHETAREVRRELSRLANGQAALLSD